MHKPIADLIYNKGDHRSAGDFLQQKHLFKIQKHKQILYNLFSAVLIGCDWHIKTCQWYQNAFYSIYSKPKVRGEGQERLRAAYQTNWRQAWKSLQNLPGGWAWFSQRAKIHYELNIATGQKHFKLDWQVFKITFSEIDLNIKKYVILNVPRWSMSCNEALIK